MSIDFEVPAEAKAIREKVRQWVHDECIPAEKELDTKPLDEVLGKLRKKARAQGLWCPFVPKQYGGMGLGPLANAPAEMGGVKTCPCLIMKTLSAVHSATLPASFNMSASSAPARFASIRAITLLR